MDMDILLLMDENVHTVSTEWSSDSEGHEYGFFQILNLLVESNSQLVWYKNSDGVLFIYLFADNFYFYFSLKQKSNDIQVGK